MYNLIKSLFQFLVIIQVLSLLLTGSTKIGIDLANSLIGIIQNALRLSFVLIIKHLKFINKLIGKAYKSTKTSVNNNKQPKEISKGNDVAVNVPEN